MAHTVPPEVSRKIVRLLNDRRMISVLARTSRTFQAVAERYLYAEVVIYPHEQSIALLHTLGHVPRVAQLVHFFRFINAPSRTRSLDAMRQMQRTAAQPEFWELLRLAIHNLGNLEYFEFDEEPMVIGQASQCHSGVLFPSPPHLQASEIRLDIQFDENVCAFLSTQKALRKLRLQDIYYTAPLPVFPESSMPQLTLYDGPLVLLDQFYHCPISRLKFSIRSEAAVSLLPVITPELYKFKMLYSLSIILLPSEMAENVVEIISHACPNLQYLSIIPYPKYHESVSYARFRDIAFSSDSSLFSSNVPSSRAFLAFTVCVS